MPFLPLDNVVDAFELLSDDEAIQLNSFHTLKAPTLVFNGEGANDEEE